MTLTSFDHTSQLTNEHPLHSTHSTTRTHEVHIPVLSTQHNSHSWSTHKFEQTLPQLPSCTQHSNIRPIVRTPHKQKDNTYWLEAHSRVPSADNPLILKCNIMWKQSPVSALCCGQGSRFCKLLSGPGSSTSSWKHNLGKDMHAVKQKTSQQNIQTSASCSWVAQPHTKVFSVCCQYVGVQGHLNVGCWQLSESHCVQPCNKFCPRPFWLKFRT